MIESVLHPGYRSVIESAEYSENESEKYQSPVISERKSVLDIEAENRGESQNIRNYEIPCRA